MLEEAKIQYEEIKDSSQETDNVNTQNAKE